MKLSDLLQGNYFSYQNSKIVYYVDKIIYSGNYNGDYTVYYSKLGTRNSYSFTNRSQNRNIVIYSN